MLFITSIIDIYSKKTIEHYEAHSEDEVLGY